MGITREEQQTGDIQKNTNRASGENQTKVIGVVFHKTFAKPRLNPHETGYLEQPQIRGAGPRRVPQALPRQDLPKAD